MRNECQARLAVTVRRCKCKLVKECQNELHHAGHYLYILLPAVAFCKLSIRELYSVCRYSLASPLSPEK